MNELKFPNYRSQGKGETISAEQFITFLNEKQRDPRLNEILYPLYDEKRAIEIIVTYEQDEDAREKSELLFNFRPKYVYQVSQF